MPYTFAIAFRRWGDSKPPQERATGQRVLIFPEIENKTFATLLRNNKDFFSSEELIGIADYENAARLSCAACHLTNFRKCELTYVNVQTASVFG